MTAGIVIVLGMGCRSVPPTAADITAALGADCDASHIQVVLTEQRDDRLTWTWSFDGIPIFGTNGKSVKIGDGWEHRFHHPRSCPPPFPADAISDARVKEIAGADAAPRRVYFARFVQVARVPGSDNAADYDNVLDAFRPALVVDGSMDIVVIDASSGDVLQRSPTSYRTVD